jgi:Holliday junction resolvase RusA-like endonuclease
LITIELSGEPKGKGRPRFGNGRTFTPAATRNYEAALRWAAQEVMRSSPPLDGPLVVNVTMYMPIPKSWSKAKAGQARSGELRPIGKPDWDNGAKITDALNEVVWRDDSQIVDGRVVKIYSDRPRLVVTVLPFPGVQHPAAHGPNCGFHTDQYRSECDCGSVDMAGAA